MLSMPKMKSDIGKNGFPVTLNYFTAQPDLQVIENSTFLVIFKSLGKKDATTKEKSLDELVSLFSKSEFQYDLKLESVIESWIKVYPKVAFDNSRNVRLLSAKVQSLFLNHVGGKAFSKYLKSSLPIWLLSTNDGDKAVAQQSYKLLVEAFDNDKDKVDVKIWQIFANDILDFANVSLTMETKQTLSDDRSTSDEDSTAKYERVVNGSLALLIRIIQLINDPDVELSLSDESFTQLEGLLDNDNLWEYSSSVFNPKSMNAALANSYLVLLKSIFQEDKADKSSQNKLCFAILSSRSLYKHLCKRVFKNFKLKSVNQMADFAYGPIVLQFLGTLIVMTRFSQLDGKKKPKEGMWEIGGSKSSSRLTDYIKLGPCNLNSIYYILLERLLVLLVNLKSLEFIESGVASKIIDIISSQIQKAQNFEYKCTAVECIMSFIKAFPEQKEDFLVAVYPKLLDALSSTRVQLRDQKNKDKYLTLLANSMTLLSDDKRDEVVKSQTNKLVEYIKKGDASIDTKSYVSLLQNTTAPNDTIAQVIDQVSLTEDDAQITRGFEVLNMIIKSPWSLTEEAKDNIIDFTVTIGQYLDKATTPAVISYIFNIWDNPLFENEFDNFEIIDDILTKYAMIELDPSDFIKKVIAKFNFTYDDCLKSDLLAEHFQKLTMEPKKEDDWDIVLHLSDGRVLSSMISNVKEDEKLEFIKKFKDYRPSTEVHLSSDIKAKVLELLQSSWNHYLIGKGFLDFVDSSSMRSLIPDSLWEFIKGLSYSEDLPFDVWSTLTSDQIDALYEKIDMHLTQLPDIDKSSLAISNSFGANIHLIQDSGSTQKLNLLGFCKLFSTASKVDTRTSYYSGLFSLYVQDFIFTENQESYSADTLLSVQASLTQKFKASIDSDLLQALETIVNDKKASNMFSYLVEKLDSTSGAISSYVARLCASVLEDLSNDINVNMFNSATIEFNSLLRQPLKLAVVLSGLGSLICSTKFDRIRNYVVAEILGVKTDKILTDGLKWVILTLNFLNVRDEGFQPIPPHRLNMVLKQFQNWLESEISFEDSFRVMRSQLMKFVTLVDADNKEDLANSLVEDNLSIIQLENDPELRYFTLKYLVNNQAENYDDLVDILLNEEINTRDQKSNNMVVRMCLDTTQRCFDKVSFKSIPDERISQLYELTIKSPFVQEKAIGIKLLEQYINSKQQELVLNYQFKNSEDAVEVDLKLPSVFLDAIQHIDPENSPEIQEITYLVAWYLLYCHFHDISYNIRNQYVSQIKSLEILPKFLNYAFIHLEVDNFKIVDSFKQFDINDKFLLTLNIYFTSCHYLGSEVQHWYNELRNVQLKREVGKFTTKEISKILNSSMLDELEASKSKLTTEVMNIKINRVINEVKCVFEIDEQTMEMVIKIPANFPLESVSVEGPKRIGLKENQWKAWLLSAQRVISLTNGSIIEAIEVFKKNVDLHFSGFEECAICYSILHQDHSLPSKNCSTCNNKFHSACLYKWFKSSGSSTCPLCRSTFNFRK